MNLLSIGVIGGADGPTAILVTSSLADFVTTAVVLVAILTIAMVWLVKRKKK